MPPPTGPSRPNRHAPSSAYTSRRDPPRRDPYPPPSSHSKRDVPDPKRGRPPPTGPASSQTKKSIPSGPAASSSSSSSAAAAATSTRPQARQRTKTPEPIVDPKPKFDIDAVGPHPGYISRTQRFVCERTIQRKLKALGTDLKDEQWRIQGVSCLDAACRSGLGIPLTTVSTAVAFFHRFRLENSLDQFHMVDVVASALYLASKVENTARKPNEIAAACLNVNVPAADRRQLEDEFYDAMQDRIVDIERLMLEATSFEFKIFDPKRLMLKILTDDFKMTFRTGSADHDAIFKLALNISKDLNYTFALIKHFHGTNAVACVELAFRLLDRGMNFDAVFRPGKPLDPQIEAALDRHEQQLKRSEGTTISSDDTATVEPHISSLQDPQNPYRRYFTSRVEVLETIMDLLDLYTVHRTVTFAGPQFTNEQIMQVKIAFNRIAQRYEVPRHANDAVNTPEEEAAEKARGYVAQLKLERDVVIDLPIEGEDGDRMQVDAPMPAPASAVANEDANRDGSRRSSLKDDEKAREKTAAAGGENGNNSTNTKNNNTATNDKTASTQQKAAQRQPLPLPTERRAVIAVRRFVLQASDAHAERRILDDHYLVKDEVYDGVHEQSDGWESVSDSDDDNRRRGSSRR